MRCDNTKCSISSSNIRGNFICKHTLTFYHFPPSPSFIKVLPKINNYLWWAKEIYGSDKIREVDIYMSPQTCLLFALYIYIYYIVQDILRKKVLDEMVQFYINNGILQFISRTYEISPFLIMLIINLLNWLCILHCSKRKGVVT